MSREYQEKLLNRLLEEIIKPVFKADGFKTDGVTFLKHEVEFMKVFNIQLDLRIENEINFTFNLGLFIGYHHALTHTYELLPDNVKESHCCYRIRASKLTYDWDKWIKINEKTKFEDIKSSVVEMVKVSVDFFKNFKTIYDLVEIPDKYKQYFNVPDLDLPLGLTLIKLGDRKLGEKLYNKGYPEFLEWLKEMKMINKEIVEKEGGKDDDFHKVLWKRFNQIAKEIKISVKDKVV